MRTRYGLALAALLALHAEGYGQSMEKRLEQKLSKPFVKSVAWETDYDVARKRSSETGKLIFVYFTRSYAP